MSTNIWFFGILLLICEFNGYILHLVHSTEDMPTWKELTIILAWIVLFVVSTLSPDISPSFNKVMTHIASGTGYTIAMFAGFLFLYKKANELDTPKAVQKAK